MVVSKGLSFVTLLWSTNCSPVGKDPFFSRKTHPNDSLSSVRVPVYFTFLYQGREIPRVGEYLVVTMSDEFHTGHLVET